MEWKPIRTAPNEEDIYIKHNNGLIAFIKASDNHYMWPVFDYNASDKEINPTYWMSKEEYEKTT